MTDLNKAIELAEKATEQLQKSHVKEYTRSNGTVVKEHDDSRQAASDHAKASKKLAADARGTTINENLLNAVKDQIVKIANDNGMILKNEFGTVENFKNFVFSLTIMKVMEVGNIPLEKAYDLVMGAGSFQNLSNEIWEKMNAAPVTQKVK